MSRFTSIPNLAVNDPVPESYFDAATELINYLSIAGDTLSSAASIAIDHRFHVVAGTTTIDSITDALGAVAGQPIDLYVQSQLTIRNNGGGTGNIRTLSGGDRVVRAGEVVSFIYDGSVWRERNTIPGAELSYIEFTAPVSVTATTEAAAGILVTADNLTFDGLTAVEVEFYTPKVTSGTDGGEVHVTLFDNGAAVGELGDWSRGTGNMSTSLTCKRRTTPSAGAHQFSIRAWRATANCTITAGAGGAGNYMPGFIRVRRLT